MVEGQLEGRAASLGGEKSPEGQRRKAVRSDLVAEKLSCRAMKMKGSGGGPHINVHKETIDRK